MLYTHPPCLGGQTCMRASQEENVALASEAYKCGREDLGSVDVFWIKTAR